MDEMVTLVVQIRPASPELPWRASLNDPRDGTPRQFDTAQALARYLERLEPRVSEQGLR